MHAVAIFEHGLAHRVFPSLHLACKNDPTASHGRARSMTPENYFTYLPKEPALRRWGCAMTGIGCTRIGPDDPYPLLAHPLDRHFEWSRGRILSTWQVVWITAGGGVFETKGARRASHVRAGDVIVLRPGLWHRYRPDPATGWTEHWIECEGLVFERALRAAQLDSGPLPLRHDSEELEGLFLQAHRHARLDPARRQSQLAMLGPQIVACLEFCTSAPDPALSLIDAAVQRAHHLLASRCHEPFDLPALARELGVGSSHLRHRFKERTGISPRRHFLESRIRKAKDLLLNTSRSIKEISDLLGFDSPSHLSRQFKQLAGSSPAVFRNPEPSGS